MVILVEHYINIKENLKVCHHLPHDRPVDERVGEVLRHHRLCHEVVQGGQPDVNVVQGGQPVYFIVGFMFIERANMSFHIVIFQTI